MAAGRGAKPQKQRKARFQQELKRSGLVRQSRFDELIAGVAGTVRCGGCGLAWPVAEIDSSQNCPPCRTRRARVQVQIDQKWPSVLDEPNVVYVDASWADGVAGLAVVGALGSHSRACLAASSTEAEGMALGWAMELAKADGARELVFRSDCTTAVTQVASAGSGLGWTVEHVPRRKNRVADNDAGLARRAWPR